MFVRIVRLPDKKYAPVVESFWDNGQPKQRLLCSLGEHDKEIYPQISAKLKNWTRLERTPLVLQKIKNSSGPLQGKCFMMQYRYRKWNLYDDVCNGHPYKFSQNCFCVIHGREEKSLIRSRIACSTPKWCWLCHQPEQSDYNIVALLDVLLPWSWIQDQ